MTTQPPTVQLVVSWAIRHKADKDTVIGSCVETFMGGLGLDAPSGWGIADPGEHPWDIEEMTWFVRSRMPEPTRLVIGGPPGTAALTMTVSRTSHGVEEVVTGFITAGLWDDSQSAKRVDMVVDALEMMCAGTMPLFAIVLVRAGWADAGANQPRTPLAPVAMLIGPPGVRELGLDVGQFQEKFGARAAGRTRLPGLVFPLVSDEEDGPAKLTRIVTTIGEDKIWSALGWNVNPQGGM